MTYLVDTEYLTPYVPLESEFIEEVETQLIIEEGGLSKIPELENVRTDDASNVSALS